MSQYLRRGDPLHELWGLQQLLFCKGDPLGRVSLGSPTEQEAMDWLRSQTMKESVERNKKEKKDF